MLISLNCWYCSTSVIVNMAQRVDLAGGLSGVESCLPVQCNDTRYTLHLSHCAVT